MSSGLGPGDARSVTTLSLREMKATGRPIVMVTAYDHSTALLVESAGVDAILVGDSLGMTMLGFDSTLPVTMDDMVRHTAAVTRAARRVLVIADMPFMSYQSCVTAAMENAARLLAEGGAHAVKVEGGARLAPTIERLVTAGVPVMGHVGLTPQSVRQLGGFRVQAKKVDEVQRLFDDCRHLESAGVFAIVLECVPVEVADVLKRRSTVPVIGIGAGAGCDGQVQVIHDLLGLGGTPPPRHARCFANVGGLVRQAVEAYANDVRSGAFPSEEHVFHATLDLAEQLERLYGGMQPSARTPAEG